MRSPRDRPAPRRPPPPARHVDPDRMEAADAEGERALFSRHVLSLQDARHAAAAKANGSPRTAAIVSLGGVGGCGSNDRAESRAESRAGTSPRSKERSCVGLQRPSSPVGAIPVEAVAAMASPRLQLIRSPRRAILGESDVEKITAWLQSLARESRHYASYALYCEMLFRESAVLTQGKPVPNRLQTAIAFHCLCLATSVFARHEHLLYRICTDLGAALYLNHDNKLIDEREIDALDFFTRLTTYYEHQQMLQQQKEDLHEEMLRQKQKFMGRLDVERARTEQLKDVERRTEIRTLEKITHRNTLAEDLTDKLTSVLQKFHFIDEEDKEKVVLGVINSLRANLSADVVLEITEDMNPVEKEKLVRGLIQDEAIDIAQRREMKSGASSSEQLGTALERSGSKTTRFHSLITNALKGPQGDGGDAQAVPAIASSVDDLSDQDRKILESVDDLIEELEIERKKNAELTQKLEEAEQLASSLRLKSNDILTQGAEKCQTLEKQVEELRSDLALANPPRDDKEVQTDKSGDDDGDDDFSGGAEGGKRSGRRRGLAAHNEDDDLIMKNRPKNKFGFGIASIIDQAKIPSSTIRKILMKRKPLTLNELHSIILGYYQAKMYQDVQDDSSGKPRANLAQFIMEMYILHYGLKDLAISQLVFLDAAIRKNSRESARVRTFGLLTGSLDPESHACSLQGIDFFMLVLVILFNAGVYKKGRKQAEAIAKHLKDYFGDGILMSPKAQTVKFEMVSQVIDMAFSYTSETSGGTLDLLKEEIRASCSTAMGGLDIDMVLEKIMNYWFVLYERQIQDIHAMFAMVDTNGDGTLDFGEFCDVVVVLEPDMDRRDVLALYNRAAGEDHVIDKDEFVQVMLSHQRGIILKELYGADSGKKTQQRKSTAPLTRMTTTLTQMEKEGSYASLAAAMEDLDVVNVQAMADNAGDDNDETGEDTTTDSSDADVVQDNISFQTLSRLSMWASEAKGKLQAFRRLSARPASRETPEGFKDDVNMLLRKALSKADVNLDDVL